MKAIFAQLESFFHGTSSGIDPLNSYLKMPLLIVTKSDIRITGLPRKKKFKDGAIFLINTGKPRKTGPLVNFFLDKFKTETDFAEKVTDTMIPVTNNCINSLVKGDISVFFENLKALSSFQFEHMKNMIPDDFQKMWNNGIESDDYYLKLCGSGGGGFILGFTANYEKILQQFQSNNIEIIPVFRSY